MKHYKPVEFLSIFIMSSPLYKGKVSNGRLSGDSSVLINSQTN